MINSGGMHNVLEVARITGARVVVASTSDVYGKNPQVPFNEESDLIYGPSTVRRWSYAVSKLFDEHLCLAYQDPRRSGSHIAVLRFLWPAPACQLVGRPAIRVHRRGPESQASGNPRGRFPDTELHVRSLIRSPGFLRRSRSDASTARFSTSAASGRSAS